MLLASGVLVRPLRAQQSESAIEVYGLTGAYFFGNDPHILKNRDWRPQIGVGALFPFGSKWAALIDGNYSKLRLNEGLHHPDTYHPASAFYKRNPGIPNEDVTTQHMIAILPAVARLWRKERYSIYIGAGLGLEHQSQLIRHRPVKEVVDPDGEPPVDSMGNLTFGRLVRADEFVESKDTVASMLLILRGGLLVRLAPRVVLRVGYSFLPAYLDAQAPQSVEVGIGYRF